MTQFTKLLFTMLMVAACGGVEENDRGNENENEGESEAEATECDSDSDCDAREVCDHDECVRPECQTDDDCDDNESCTEDVCGSDYICNHVETRELCPPVECDSDSDCEDGRDCTDDLCTSDNECLYVEVEACNPECDSDSDCSDGDSCTTDDCVAGNCRFNEIDGCGDECTVDADCTDGDSCTTDDCVAGDCSHESNGSCGGGGGGSSSECDDPTTVIGTVGFEDSLEDFEGAESGGADVTVSRVTNESHDGDGSMKIVCEASNSPDYYECQAKLVTNELDSGETYRISFWARADGAREDVFQMIGDSDWSCGESFDLDLTAEWTYYAYVIYAESCDEPWRLSVNTGAANGTVWLDQFEVERCN